MTNIYVRIEREGRFQPVEIEHLTAAELEDFAAAQPVEAGWRWTIRLVQWIQNTVLEGEA